MLKKPFLVLIIVVAFSCQQEITTDVAPVPAEVSVVDGRLVFASEEVYLAKKKEVEYLKPSQREVWISQYKFKTLHSLGYEGIAKIGYDNLSPGHLLLLNADRLMQIGSDVVYFGEATKYLMNVEEYNKLVNKSDIMKSDRTLKFIGQELTRDTKPNGRVHFNAWSNGSTGIGGSQLSFSYGSGRKFVDVWVSYVEQVSGSAACSQDVRMVAHLWLRPRLEMISGGSWVPCYERRDVEWDFTFDTTYYYYGKHTCSYLDTQAGPFSGHPADSDFNLSSYYNSIPVQDFGPFDGEWYATVALKNWDGYAQGSMKQCHQLSGVCYTYTF